MDKKKIIAIVIIFTIIACAAIFITKRTDMNDASEQQKNETVQTKNVKSNNKNNAKKTTQASTSLKNDEGKSKEVTVKADLFENSSEIPLSAIAAIADTSPEINNIVKKVLSANNNIFMAKKNGDKLILVVENQENIRHGIDFIEISLKNGHQIRSTLGYSDKMQDSDNDIWEYDKTSELPTPTKHVKFNNQGDVEFIETWNYDSENPVKYEMKNAEGKPLSIKKETVDNDTNMRVEHLVYDKDGTTKMNVSATYEGADIKRFTYYNADKPSEGASIFSEYSDGLKTKEDMYTSDLKLQNTYVADYKDGQRIKIKILDTDNNEVEELTKE